MLYTIITGAAGADGGAPPQDGARLIYIYIYIYCYILLY